MRQDKKDYFDSVALSWDKGEEPDQEKINFIIEKLEVRPGHKILDVGCGTGLLVPYLWPKVGKEGNIVGIDLSPGMIKIAREKFLPDLHPNLEFRIADILNFQSPPYDRVISYNSFAHLSAKRKAIAHMANLLIRGGILIIAHSLGRETLNELHRSIPGPISRDLLPPAKRVANYFTQANLLLEELHDDKDLYLLKGRKIS